MLFRSKQYYRNFVKNEFSKLTSSELDKRSLALTNQLIKNPVFNSSSKIMVYLPLKDEVQLQPLFKIKKQFYIPKISNDNLQPVRLYENIPIEPNQLDLIIVPGRAFTKQGIRVGRGQGYYDRFLAKLLVPTVALAFTFQIFSKLPTEEHDVTIDKIISEGETRSFL